jgi:hypothetical protein
MLKPIGVLLATGLAVLCIGSFAGATGPKPDTQHNAATVIAVLGRRVTVTPGKFSKAFAYCPRGYHVTGGGAYAGAITEIVSSPTSDLRGWFVDGFNNDPKTTFGHQADAVCAKGNPPAPRGAAASNGLPVRTAEAEFLSQRKFVGSQQPRAALR